MRQTPSTITGQSSRDTVTPLTPNRKEALSHDLFLVWPGPPMACPWVTGLDDDEVSRARRAVDGKS